MLAYFLRMYRHYLYRCGGFGTDTSISKNFLRDLFVRNYQLPKVPETVKVPFTAICDTILHLCETKLNQEHFEACVELGAKLARKRPSPLLHGNIKTWTAGVVH